MSSQAIGLRLAASLAVVLLATACDRQPHVPSGPPIVSAAAAGDLRAVRDLVGKDKSALLVADEKGNTAAIWAVLNDKPEIAQYLVEQGYPIDPTPKLPFGLLFACTSRYSPESTATLEWLLKRGANPNVEYVKEAWTPLLLAVNNNMQDKVRLLVAYGANVNQANGRGETPRSLISDRLRKLRDPGFDLPHGEFRDASVRAKAIEKAESMMMLLNELGAGQ